MGKEIITKDGVDLVVREDTAKAYRFVKWGILTAAICLAILAVVFFGLFAGSAGR